MLEFTPSQVIEEALLGLPFYLATFSGYFCLIFGGLFYFRDATQNSSSIYSLRKTTKFPITIVIDYWLATELSNDTLYFFKGMIWRFIGLIIYSIFIFAFANQIYSRYQHNWFLSLVYGCYIILSLANFLQSWNFASHLRNQDYGDEEN